MCGRTGSLVVLERRDIVEVFISCTPASLTMAAQVWHVAKPAHDQKLTDYLAIVCSLADADTFIRMLTLTPNTRYAAVHAVTDEQGEQGFARCAQHET